MKLKNLLLSALLAFICLSKATGQNLYCVPEGLFNQITKTEWLTTNPRFIKTVAIEGATFNGKSVEFSKGINTETVRAPNVYYNQTADVLNATVGDQLKISWTKSASLTWMHYYAYIDYNADGTFDENTETVSWTYYKGTNSLGQSRTDGADAFELPLFTIPENTKTGPTRLRIKCDWDSKNPCENTVPTNYLYLNAGSIIDFTLNIASKKKPILTITQPANGSISVADEKGNIITTGSEIPTGTLLTFTTTPTSPKEHLKYLLVNGIPIVGNQTIITEHITLSAEFTPDWYIKYITSTGGNINLTNKSDDTIIANETELANNTLANIALTTLEGYDIKSVTINGQNATSLFTQANHYTITLTMTEHKNIEVIFAKKQYAVKLIQTEKWGSLSIDGNNAIPNGGAVMIEHGSSLTIIARPDPCEESWLEKLIVNGTDRIGDVTDYILKLTVTSPLEITAVFAIHTYSIQFYLDGLADVSILDENKNKPYVPGEAIPENTLISWTITPAKGYSLDSIKENKTEFDLSKLENGKHELGRLTQDYVYDIKLTNNGSGLHNTKANFCTIYYKNGWLFLEDMQAEDSIVLLNTAGSKIKIITTNQVDLSNLANDCYLIQITRNKEINIQKIIKK